MPRGKLAEARLQADLETLRSEHTILRRTLETLIKMHEAGPGPTQKCLISLIDVYRHVAIFG